MTLSQLFADLTAAFQKFESPQLEARHLLLEALNIDLNQLVLRGENSISESDLIRIQTWRSRAP
ncbi:MAG: hypothetical protein HC883_04605 [Bdellovibrionaceae bacterium]|nr:hypothetical protein [Pseudobdellovibrionaceae bacterium]